MCKMNPNFHPCEGSDAKMRMDVEYLGESGFLVSSGEDALLFDPGTVED